MEKGLAILSRNRSLIAIFSFLLGVFISSFVPLSLVFSCFFLILALGVFLYSFFNAEIELKKAGASFAIFLAFVSAGALRYNFHNQTQSDPAFAAKIGQTITLQSIIVEEPQDKGTYEQYLVLAPGGLERVLVKGANYPKFHYGDEVKFEGKLQLPQNFETDQGTTFDYVSYLQKDNIHYILSFANGTFISAGNGNAVASTLFSLKQKFISNIESLIPEPESSLLAGILLGVQDSLGKDLNDIFRNAGIIHIVVLSGYNITVVAESIIKVLSFLPKNFALGSGVVGIILFSIMVGGTPSVLRASVMALLALLARATGRTYDIGRALLIAAFAMVFWNPNILVFDTSFELSFLSTIAIIWIAPLFEARFTKIPEKFGIREIFSATLATQLFVLPLLLYKVGQMSVVGLLVNLLVLGVIPTIMFMGFAAGMLAFISYSIAFPIALVAQFLLAYVIKVAELFAALPFAAVHVSYFPAILFWAMYALYGFLFWKVRILNKYKKSTL